MTMMVQRRSVLAGLVAAGALGGRLRAGAPAGFSDADFARAIVIDGLGGPESDAKWDAAHVAMLRRSGMTAWQITVGDVGPGPDTWDMTIASIAGYNLMVEAHPDLLRLATSAADIRAAKAEGKAAFLYNIQNTVPIAADLDRLEVLKGLGVRQVQLTYNLRNASGDGALEPANAGLSKFGHKVIERIEAEKLLLDLSHGGARTIDEAIAAAKRPPIISHTGCRAITDHPRNVSDAAIRAVAQKGGVVGIYFMPYLAIGRPATRADAIAHIEHAVGIAGEDHVSIGTDGGLEPMDISEKALKDQIAVFNQRSAAGIAAPGEGPGLFPTLPDYNRVDRFHVLADDLAKRGWPAARIEKLLGANLLRLYGEVWGA